MRSSTGVSGFVLGAAVVFCFFHPIQPEVSGSSSAHASDRATPKQRADAVEQSLIPLYFLEGERPTYANLLRRMTELHVPGVTIAAIHGGHVDRSEEHTSELQSPA